MKRKPLISLETFVFLGVLVGAFVYLGQVMGVGPLFSTLIKTAHALLLDVVLLIMAVSVLTGALAQLLSDFGVVALLNRLISPAMRGMYELPGAASLAVLTTFLSDNPAVLTLTNDKGFTRYFQPWQLPTLCNLGTSFGMGLVLSTYMISLGHGTDYVLPTMIGVLGAVLGSVVSVRLMMVFCRRAFGIRRADEKTLNQKSRRDAACETRLVQGSIFQRITDDVLIGGKAGVDMGMSIIPGVLIVCTAVMMLTFGPGDTGYTGAAYEGVALLPKLGRFLQPVTDVLFGFSNEENITFPLTSLGAVGAAMGLVPHMIEAGTAGPNEIAVFTAMGMCWSGYLSTHVSMMDALGQRRLIGKALLSHTIGGIFAGICAHYLYLLFV